MARITFTESAKAGQASTVNIPDEVKEDVEAAYKHLRENPTKEGFVTFGDGTKWDTLKEEVQKAVKTERNAWVAQVRGYVATREAGALKFRILPSKHLTPAELRFKLSADLPANGEREGNTAP
jgi:hypothetical protein